MLKTRYGILFVTVLFVLTIFCGVAPAERVIRFAHFTDIHMTQDNNAPQGLTQALRHMQTMEDKPELLVTGGDHVMDSFSVTDEVATAEFNLVKDILKKECKIPIKYCIGNHDLWGWDEKGSGTTGKEEFWGEKRPVHEFNMPGRYYSFDVKNWHFIILDSLMRDKDSYMAKLDDEQFKWLGSELEKNKDKYIAIFSHVPILSVAVFFDDDESEKSGDWSVYRGEMHIDARKLKDLFSKYPGVKLCISGHVHLFDRVEYNDVTYICDGAVCGAWWGGKYKECKEGYGIFDLYSDGTFKHKYVTYGWTAPAAKK
jgi:3',5'-cyclic AMP phosphodiesterase CpdA